MSKNNTDVTCASCGATYSRDLTNCPYCGSANYYGQEKQFMRGLSGIRQRLSDAADVDNSLIVKEILKVTGIIVATALAIIIATAVIIAADANHESEKTEQIRNDILYEIQR